MSGVYPRHFIAQCTDCGRWTSGPFRGRQDVPLSEIQDYMEPLIGHRPASSERPTHVVPGHTLYTPESLMSAEPYSGTLCSSCVDAWHAQSLERQARMRAAMAPPEPEPPLSATGSSDDADGGSE